MSFGASVRMGLAKAKIEQGDLAKIVGVRRETVNSWCTDKSVPAHARQVEVAEVFTNSHSEFLKWGEL